MKSSKTIFLILLLLTLSQVNAQYGYNNGYGNNNSGYGSGRMDRTNQVQDMPEKPKEIPVEVTVAEIMKKLKPELKLDDLQEIAVGHVLKESIRSQSIIFKDETTSQEQKLKEIEALTENTTRKINEFLSPEQREMYKKLAERRPDSKRK